MKANISIYDPAREYFFEEGCFINELSNSDADPAVSMAQARVAPGQKTRWHLLQGITERYVLLRGSGIVEVDGLEPRGVGPGDVVTIPPGARQRISNPGAEDLVFLAVCTPRFTAQAYVDVQDESAL